MIQFLGNIEAKADAKEEFHPCHLRKQLQAASEERLVLRKDVYQGLPGALPGKCMVCNAKTNFAAG